MARARKHGSIANRILEEDSFKRWWCEIQQTTTAWKLPNRRRPQTHEIPRNEFNPKDHGAKGFREIPNY
jgi:hypothetical protein